MSCLYRDAAGTGSFRRTIPPNLRSFMAAP